MACPNLLRIKLRAIITIFILISIGSLSTNCDSYIAKNTDSVYMDYDYQKLGYKLFAPAKKTFLKYDLEEISGLSYYESGKLAAIEDEEGKLYILDSADGKILREIKFAKPGDYEGVEIVANTAYILRSDGDIYYFDITASDELEAAKYETILMNENDAEGLASKDNDLLIALKGSGDTEDNKTKGKAVYNFSADEKRLAQKEVLSINEDVLNEFIKERKFFNNINDFDPSAIAIHPSSGDLYLLSADKVLVVFDPDYKLKEVIRLHPIIYNQAEGICFSPEGTMFISSEGDGGKGKLIRINYAK